MTCNQELQYMLIFINIFYSNFRVIERIVIQPKTEKITWFYCDSISQSKWI
jgi:hypothetical protein